MNGIEAGAAVDIALDQLPGRIFEGTVTSKGFAVNQPSTGAAGELVTIKGESCAYTGVLEIGGVERLSLGRSKKADVR